MSFKDSEMKHKHYFNFNPRDGEYYCHCGEKFIPKPRHESDMRQMVESLNYAYPDGGELHEDNKQVDN